MRHVGILREVVFTEAQQPWVMFNALPQLYGQNLFFLPLKMQVWDIPWGREHLP